MPKIDCSQIPRVQLDILSRALLSDIELFYSDPENIRRFEEWQHSAEGKAYAECTGLT